MRGTLLQSNYQITNQGTKCFNEPCICANRPLTNAYRPLTCDVAASVSGKINNGMAVLGVHYTWPLGDHLFRQLVAAGL